MNTEGYEQWFKLNKNLNLSAFGNWHKVANKTFYQIMENNLECLSDCVNNTCSTLSQQFKNYSEEKPENILSLQKDCVREVISTVVGNTQKVINTSIKNMEELTNLYTSREAEATRSTEKSGSTSTRNS